MDTTAIVAGRDLDALIAEKVFGFQVIRDWPCGDDPECGRYYAAGSLQEGLIEESWIFTKRDIVIRNEQAVPWERTRIVPAYSTDLAAAWLVVEHLEAHSLEWHLDLYRMHDDDDRLQWWAEFNKQRSDYAPAGNHVTACADTPALAICRAALATVDAGNNR